MTLGGDLVRISPTVAFRGPGGDVELLGLCFADAGQHLEQRLLVDHAVPHCRSNVLYKNALQGDGAHTVWIGDVLIRGGRGEHRDLRDQPQPAAHRAAPAPTRCRTWRSRPARSSAPGTPARPGGSTTSSCSTCSPAASRRTSRARLVVRGFFGEVLARIALPELRERLEAAIEAELAVTGV